MTSRDRDKIFEQVELKERPLTPRDLSTTTTDATKPASAQHYQDLLRQTLFSDGEYLELNKNTTVPTGATIYANTCTSEELTLQERDNIISARDKIDGSEHIIKVQCSKNVFYLIILVGIVAALTVLTIIGLVLAALNSTGLKQTENELDARLVRMIKEFNDFNKTLSIMNKSFMDSQEGFDQLRSSTDGNFTLLRTQLDTLSTNSTILYSELVNNLSTQQNKTNSSLQNLDSSIHDLGRQLEHLGLNVSSVGNKVEQVKQSFEDFSHSPLSLYEGCIEETEECSFTPSPLDYSPGCSTRERPVNVMEYITLDLQCNYFSNSTVDSIETNILRLNGSNVRCECSIFGISDRTGEHTTIIDISNTTWKCSLKILRCLITLDRN